MVGDMQRKKKINKTNLLYETIVYASIIMTNVLYDVLENKIAFPLIQNDIFHEAYLSLNVRFIPKCIYICQKIWVKSAIYNEFCK